MTMDLSKGEKVNLHKNNASLRIGHCGLSWDISPTPQTMDLDLFFVACDANNKAVGEGGVGVIYYRYKQNENKSIWVLEDNLTGAGDGFDEQGFIDFSKVPANVKSIFVCVSIYEYDIKRQNFGQVNNARIDVLDGDTKTKLVGYDLTEDMSNGTGVIVCRFMRENEGGWSFKAMGEILPDGMPGILRKYGL
jgi:tellurium resistance protein TerD